MTCNICGVNEATIHLTEIINSQMIEIHLCESCAQEKGTDFKTHFNFGDLLAGLSDFDQGSEVETEHAVKCPDCGMTYEAFTKSGRLGCSGCYAALGKMLSPLIKRVQRSSVHVGKKPSRLTSNVRNTHDLGLLQDKLRNCVQDEQFEEAAKLRDQIRKIEIKLKKIEKDKK